MAEVVRLSPEKRPPPFLYALDLDHQKEDRINDIA